MQCGFPMHKFCYKKSDKGCPGVCNYKYTLSGKGYPCFSDHSNTDCAWCNKEGWHASRTPSLAQTQRREAAVKQGPTRSTARPSKGIASTLVTATPMPLARRKPMLASLDSIGSVNVTRDGLATESNVWTATAHLALCPVSKLRLP